MILRFSIQMTLVCLFCTSCSILSHSKEVTRDSLVFKKQSVFWIDHDGGYDVDDYIAHVTSALRFGSQIVGASTTMYYPDDKARLSRLIYSELGVTIPVYAGEGLYRGQENLFKSMYPAWPPQFGGPYPLQGQPYYEIFGEKLNAFRTESGGVDQLIAASHRYGKRLVIVVQGPMTNIAAVLQKDPDFGRRVDSVVVMGGWFETPDHQLIRLGYNTILDLDATKRALTDLHLKVVVVNSQMIKDSKLIIHRHEELEPMIASQERSLLGRALVQDLQNWEAHSRNTMGDIVLADPVAALIARYPHLIASQRFVKLEFSPLNDLHMLSKGTGKLIAVREVAPSESNVMIVDSLHSPELIRKAMVSDLQSVISPKRERHFIDLQGITPSN